MVKKLFLTPPAEIPEGEECRTLKLPASKEWLGVFNSALLMLTNPYNWEQINDTDLTPDEATVIAMALIEEYWATLSCATASLPGGKKVIRILLNGHFEELSDAGEWQEPTGDYAIPPITPREGGTPQEQMCLAAANAANVLQQLYEQAADMFQEHLSTAAALAAIIEAIALAIGAAFGLIGTSIVAIAVLVWGVVYESLEFIGADLWDVTFTATMKCILLDCASNTDGVVTFDFECVNQALAAQTNPFDLTASQIRLFGQLQYLFMIFGGDGLNAAGATTEITEADCDCGEWCGWINLKLTSEPLTIAAGNWQEGNGIYQYQDYANGYNIIDTYYDPGEAAGVTFIKFYFWAIEVGSPGSAHQYLQTEPGHVIVSDGVMNTYDENDIQYEGAPGSDGYRIVYLLGDPSPDHNGGYLYAVEVHGIGTKPEYLLPCPVEPYTA
jgi:hypothetical protein